MLGGEGDVVIFGEPATVAPRLVKWRLDLFVSVDGRPTLWNRTEHADPNPMPRLRLFRWSRRRGR